MLRGKVKQKWFFVSSMIRVAIDALSGFVCVALNAVHCENTNHER